MSLSKKITFSKILKQTPDLPSYSKVLKGPSHLNAFSMNERCYPQDHYRQGEILGF